MFGLFKKKRFDEDHIEFANEIVTASLMLAERYLKSRNDKLNSNDDYDTLIKDITNEFIFFFFHCISRECFLIGMRKAQLEIYDSIAKLVFNIITIDLSDEFRNHYADMFSAAQLKAENAYAKCRSITIIDDKDVFNETVVFEASKRIAVTNEKEDILLASDMILLGLKAMKVKERVVALYK